MTQIYLWLNKVWNKRPEKLSLISVNAALYKEFLLVFDLRKCLSKKDGGEEESEYFSFALLTMGEY